MLFSYNSYHYCLLQLKVPERQRVEKIDLKKINNMKTIDFYNLEFYLYFYNWIAKVNLAFLLIEKIIFFKYTFLINHGTIILLSLFHYLRSELIPNL